MIMITIMFAAETIRDRARERGPTPRAGPALGLFLFFGGIILTTIIASVAPFGAFHFRKSQQYAALANLIAVPICNIVVMPAALAALVFTPLGLEAWLLWVLGYGVQAMVWLHGRQSSRRRGPRSPHLRTVVWHDRAGRALAVSLAQAVAIPGTSDHRLWCRLRAGA
jgi:hypothetical protein